MSELVVHPGDSDIVAQLKIAATCMLLATMVGGAFIEIPDIGVERNYRLLGMTGFTIGMYIDRTWWTS